MVETVKSTGGSGVASTDEEILQAMELLAETEGHLHRTGRRRDACRCVPLVRRGVIPADESVVVCITGNGYKTAAETIAARVPRPSRSAARSPTSKLPAKRGIDRRCGVRRRRRS